MLSVYSWFLFLLFLFGLHYSFLSFLTDTLCTPLPIIDNPFNIPTYHHELIMYETAKWPYNALIPSFPPPPTPKNLRTTPHRPPARPGANPPSFPLIQFTMRLSDSLSCMHDALILKTGGTIRKASGNRLPLWFSDDRQLN